MILNVKRILQRVMSVIFCSVILTFLLTACGGGETTLTSTTKLSLTATPMPTLTIYTGKGQPLPDPPNKSDRGPASNIIPAAATTLRIDPNNIALQPQNTFQVGIPFYVTYSVQLPDKAGVVTVKWYMNNLYFGSAKSQQINTKMTINGSASIAFTQPAEGKVELYWNDQLAQRLYFVVR